MNVARNLVEFSLRDYGDFVRQNRSLWIFLSICLAAVFVVIVAFLPSRYEAQAAVKVGIDPGGPFTARPASVPHSATLNRIRTEVELVRSRKNLYRVVDRYRLQDRWEKPSRFDSLLELQKRLRVESRAGTSIVDVFFVSDSAEEAAEVANSIVDQYVGSHPERGVAGLSPSVAEWADIPVAKKARSWGLILPCVLLVSSLIATSLLIIQAKVSHGGELFDRMERRLGVDLVTLVRRKDGKGYIDMEPYREVRERIHRIPGGPSKLITTLGCAEGEGRSEAVTNLATVFADAGQTVLLIDGDLQNPSLHTAFNAAHHPGLSDYLRGEMRVEEAVVRTPYPNLWFMPSGPACADSCSLLSGKRMTDMIWDMKRRFDYVFLNSPPIFGVSDSFLLTGYADHTLIVCDFHRSSVKTLTRAKKAVEIAGGNFAGVILSTNPAGKRLQRKIVASV